ncbi:hypothetical protein ABTE68_20130, partial [Acinetobacter baumannii]
MEQRVSARSAASQGLTRSAQELPGRPGQAWRPWLGEVAVQAQAQCDVEQEEEAGISGVGVGGEG